MNATPKSMRLRIGIFGRTNTGKSSFLNLITGQSAAIVSPVAGTTTDVVEDVLDDEEAPSEYTTVTPETVRGGGSSITAPGAEVLTLGPKQQLSGRRLSVDNRDAFAVFALLPVDAEGF